MFISNLSYISYMDEKTALIEWGLDEKEAITYLCILKNGTISAHGIAKKTGLLRQTTYEILNRLEAKGLVSQIIKDKRTYFEAAKPDRFNQILDEKKELIQNILPSLESFQLMAQITSQVKVFKGIKGIKTVMNEFLKARTELKMIQSEDVANELLKEFYINNWGKKRIEKKVYMKILAEKQETEFELNTMLTNKKELRETKVNSTLKGNQLQIVIFDSTVVLTAFREEPISIYIEDEFFSNSFNIFFDNYWNTSKTV